MGYRKYKARVSLVGKILIKEVRLVLCLKRTGEYLNIWKLEGEVRLLTHTKQMDCEGNRETLKGLDILSKEFRLSVAGNKGAREI